MVYCVVARLNCLALMVYGGTIMPGQSQLDHQAINIESAFQSFGAPCSAPMHLRSMH